MSQVLYDTITGNASDQGVGENTETLLYIMYLSRFQND
jgi:hypothetical protein